MSKARNTTPYSLRLDPDVLSRAKDVATLAGLTMRQLVESGLEHETSRRLEDPTFRDLYQKFRECRDLNAKGGAA